MNERLTENFATHCCLFRHTIPCELRAIIQTYRSFNSTNLSHVGSSTTSSSACRQIVKNMTQVGGISRGVDHLHDIGDLLDVLMDLPTFESLAFSSYGDPYPFVDSRSLCNHRDVLNKLNDTQLDIVLDVLKIDGYTLFRSLSPIERVHKYYNNKYHSILPVNVFGQAITNNAFLTREERKRIITDILTGKYFR